MGEVTLIAVTYSVIVIYYPQDRRPGNYSHTPYANFRVTPGKRYRFRVIAATCLHCYTRFTIEGHRLKLIAADGNSVKPVDVDYFDIFTGINILIILKYTGCIVWL